MDSQPIHQQVTLLASLLGLICGLLFTVQNYISHDDIGAISTAFLHVPMAIFGFICSLVTIQRHPIFSLFITAFIWLNAFMI